jgi:hypothetical protein
VTRDVGALTQDGRLLSLSMRTVATRERLEPRRPPPHTPDLPISLFNPNPVAPAGPATVSKPRPQVSTTPGAAGNVPSYASIRAFRS